MNTCTKCEKQFPYQLKNDICLECAIKETIQDKKCTLCDNNIISDNNNDTLCEACSRKKSSYIKKTLEIVGGVMLLVGGGIYTWLKSKEPS